MSHLMAEFLGTMILVLLGDGVCANCNLSKSKGQSSGWIVIATGWGLAVGIPAFIFGEVSNSFNPALTIALAAIGKFPAASVPGYVAAQMAGGFVGAVLVWLLYLPHWKVTEDKDAIINTFCTTPAIRDLKANFLTEVIATAILVFGIVGIGSVKSPQGLAPLIVGLLIFAIGLSLGGPTGYSMNPARDLSPRIAHAILPIPGKRDSDWSYAWIPSVGPIVGALIGAFLFVTVF